MPEDPPCKILVVDDEVVICELIFRLLERTGRTIHKVNSGAEAISLIEAESYDLLVVDKNMPEVPGFEVIKRAREKDPNIATLLVTAYATDELPAELDKFGVDDHVTKPFNVAEFDAKVRILLAKRFPA
jgi:DNA-binding response OmpR family regulator